MQLKGKKILFASTAMDGHFNPLTGLAKYLQNQGRAFGQWHNANHHNRHIQFLLNKWNPGKAIFSNHNIEWK